jgi:hypothetical protein
VSSVQRVRFRAHLDRFPLAVKGALILRAIDGIPHQVAFRQAVVHEMSGATSFPIGLDDVVQDVGPTKDLFVPFEFPSTDLASGWYRLECSVLVDGSPESVKPGEPFLVSWPRGATRRGSLDVGTAVHAGHGKVRIERVELSTDHVAVIYEAPEPIAMKLFAGDRTLSALGNEHDAETGRGSFRAYPILKSEDHLTIEIRGSGAIEVPLT